MPTPKRLVSSRGTPSPLRIEPLTVKASQPIRDVQRREFIALSLPFPQQASLSARARSGGRGEMTREGGSRSSLRAAIGRVSRTCLVRTCNQQARALRLRSFDRGRRRDVRASRPITWCGLLAPASSGEKGKERERPAGLPACVRALPPSLPPARPALGVRKPRPPLRCSVSRAWSRGLPVRERGSRAGRVACGAKLRKGMKPGLAAAACLDP